MGQWKSMNARMRSNFLHLYADVFWYGVLLGSSMAFIAVYASRLGAGSFQIGLLTAGPSVVNLLFSLPAGRWLEQRSLYRITYLTAFWNRLTYVFMIPLPWLFSDRVQVWMLVLISLIMSLPGTILAIAFNALFAEVVPAEFRAEVVGKRNALLAISTALASLGCGQLLDRISFPLNYQVVFTIGAIGAMMSTYHLWKIQPIRHFNPNRNSAPIHDLARPGIPKLLDALRRPIGLRHLLLSNDEPLLRWDILRGKFGSFIAACLFFYIFVYLPIPLFPLFLVHDLHLSDGAISLGNALYYVSMLIFSLSLRRWSERLGNRRILAIGGLTIFLYPLFTGLAKNAILYWVGTFVSGSAWALANAGLVNRLMERVPEDDRPAHMALHNLVLNIGILVGSLLGPTFGEALGLRNAILFSVLLRLLGGVFLVIWG
jgi:MFS family permease